MLSYTLLETLYDNVSAMHNDILCLLFLFPHVHNSTESTPQQAAGNYELKDGFPLEFIPHCDVGQERH